MPGAARARAPRKPLYKHWAFWASFFLLVMFPAVGVNSASPAARLGWVIVLSILFMLAPIIHARASKDPDVQSAELQVRRRPVAMAIIVATLALALILSVAATYTMPERPVLWQMTMFVAQVGSTIFPVVGKFATHITPPLAPATLYKVQSITAFFLLASLVTVVMVISNSLSMSSRERRALLKVQERYGRKIRSPALMWLCMAVAVVFGLAVFFGWIGFSSEPKYMSGKRCLVTAACYVQDDILLLVGAFFVSFMILATWGGAALMLRDAIDRDSDN